MFPQFYLELTQLSFNGKAFGQALGGYIGQAMRAAARAFLIAISTRIPQRTGFLRGAFGNLEDIVGQVPRRGVAWRKNEYYYERRVGRFGLKKGVRRGGILKTPNSGRQFATQSENLIFNVSGMQFSFNYNVNISYYAPNDVIHGWLSWLTATTVFKNTLINELTRYPRLLSYLTTSVVTTLSGGGTRGNITYVGNLEQITESQTVRQ